MEKRNLNLEIKPKKSKTWLFEEEQTLEVPLKIVSSRMLIVFEKDVLSKINTQY